MFAEKLIVESREASGLDFTGCGKTQYGGRRGIYPLYSANEIKDGFSRGELLFTEIARISEFFRSLFRRAANAADKLLRRLKKRQGTTSVVPQMPHNQRGL